MTQSFRLGDFCFQLTSSDQQLCNRIGSLLQPHKINIDVDKGPLSLIDIDFPLEIVPNWEEIVADPSGLEIVRLIVRRALNYHKDFLWFDAATLISPSGKVVLIAGASHSGKSTAATALTFGCDWKVLAEDISLVDPKKKELKTFASPLSLREGSLARIEKATHVVPGPLLDDEWVPIKDHLYGKDIHFKIDLAVELLIPNPRLDQPIAISPLQPSAFERALLPLCNAMHLNNGFELLAEGLENAQCFRIAGGSLEERLNFIIEKVSSETLPSEIAVQKT